MLVLIANIFLHGRHVGLANAKGAVPGLPSKGWPAPRLMSEQVGKGVGLGLSPLLGWEYLNLTSHPTAHAVGYFLLPLRGSHGAPIRSQRQSVGRPDRAIRWLPTLGPEAAIFLQRADRRG